MLILLHSFSYVIAPLPTQNKSFSYDLSPHLVLLAGLLSVIHGVIMTLVEFLLGGLMFSTYLYIHANYTLVSTEDAPDNAEG